MCIGVAILREFETFPLSNSSKLLACYIPNTYYFDTKSLLQMFGLDWLAYYSISDVHSCMHHESECILCHKFLQTGGANKISEDFAQFSL